MKTTLIVAFVILFAISCTNDIVDYETLEKKEGVSSVIGINLAYTGKVVLYYDNGQIKHEENLIKGVKHGIYLDWFKCGQRKTEGQFAYGKRNGRWIWWFENGKECYEVDYNNGIAYKIARDQKEYLAVN